MAAPARPPRLCETWCRLCTAEQKQTNAICLATSGIHTEISLIPDIVGRECCDGKEHFLLCPTEALQAAVVLPRAFSAVQPAQ